MNNYRISDFEVNIHFTGLLSELYTNDDVYPIDKFMEDDEFDSIVDGIYDKNEVMHKLTTVISEIVEKEFGKNAEVTSVVCSELCDVDVDDFTIVLSPMSNYSDCITSDIIIPISKVINAVYYTIDDLIEDSSCRNIDDLCNAIYEYLDLPDCLYSEIFSVSIAYKGDIIV